MSSIGITWPEPTTNKDEGSDDKSCTTTESEDTSESDAEEQVSTSRKEEVSEENKAKGKVSEDGGNCFIIYIYVFQPLVEACATKFQFALHVCPYPTHALPALQVKRLQLLSPPVRWPPL